MKEQKILFVHHGRVIGGAPTSLRNTVIGLQREGFSNIKILCAFPAMKSFFQETTGVEVGDIYSPHLIVGRVLIGYASLLRIKTAVYFFLELLKAPLIVWRQLATLRREAPDLVHLNSSVLVFVAISTRLLGIPLVWHVREVLVGRKYNVRRRIVGWIIRRLADRVICISEEEARNLGQNSFGNVYVIYNFIDFSEYASVEIDTDDERRKYGIGDGKVYVSLGGVSFRKGTVEILQAASKRPDDCFLIAGTYPEKRAYSNVFRITLYLVHRAEDALLKCKIKKIYSWLYTQRVEELYFDSKAQNVVFVGKLDDVIPILALCDALIFAGCTPHFPRPVFEAWAMKKPVVVFDMAGIVENVADGIDGVVCKTNDANGLIAALDDVKPCMGKEGRKKALQKFSMATNVNLIAEIYLGILFPPGVNVGGAQ